jgi:hypothetical protein
LKTKWTCCSGVRIRIRRAKGARPAELLMRLARRELPIGDPAYDHFAKCSPCYQELRAIQQGDAVRLAVAVKRKRLAYAAAAILIVAIAGSWFAIRQTGSLGPMEPSVAQGEQAARLDLRPFAVTRGDDRTKEPEALVLSRARMKATILLPVGSEPGDYEVQILDANLQSRARSTGTAAMLDFVTTLETTLDTTALAPGSYQVALRRRGEDWQLFPAQLR